MAKTAAEKQKAYRDRIRNSNAPVTESNAPIDETLPNSNGNAPEVTHGNAPMTATEVRNAQPNVTLEQIEPAGCPDDWLDRINSLPVGVVRPLFGVTGELRDKTNRQLQTSMPRMNWDCSQAYAEVVYRLLYWEIDKLDFVPLWRANQEAIPC